MRANFAARAPSVSFTAFGEHSPVGKEKESSLIPFTFKNLLFARLESSGVQLANENAH